MIFKKRGITMDLFENNGQEEDFQGNDAVIHLVLDDDAEMDCVVIAAFEVEETNYEYVALLPIDEGTEDEEESEVLLYRYSEDEDGDITLDNIETDEEYDLAAEAFFAIVEDMDDEESEEE
jgi:uncharacterized protein YrzB (UPF0473 family)